MIQKTVTVTEDMTKIDLTKSFLEIYDNINLSYSAYSADVALNFNNVKYPIQLRINV